MSNKFNTEPRVKVGILTTFEPITFRLQGVYTLDGHEYSGEHTAKLSADNRVEFQGKIYDTILFQATSPECTFEIKDVVIGVNFHWERKENQRFRGDLCFLFENGLVAVDIVPVEDYLTSVISSEMSATASLELLKAHAVISRSWLLAQMVDKEIEERKEKREDFCTAPGNDEHELIRWYDHSAHVLFDVCADDHCQRYQGITRQSTPTVVEAIAQTRGEVLLDGDRLCDARFSKCCGGVFEEFESCWEPVHYNYLVARRDSV